jgi:hypothetical protein
VSYTVASMISRRITIENDETYQESGGGTFMVHAAGIISVIRLVLLSFSQASMSTKLRVTSFLASLTMRTASRRTRTLLAS